MFIVPSLQSIDAVDWAEGK